MKILQFFFAVALVSMLTMGCEQHDYLLVDDDPIALRNHESERMVPFKGNFEVIPVSDESIVCLDANGDPAIPLVKFNTVKGNATHLGLIVGDESEFTIESCFVDFGNGTLTLNDLIEIRNKKGDGLRFQGQSVVDLATNLGLGHYTVVEGFGKFENASGEMTTYGNLNNDPPTFVADGMVSQPNH